MEYQVYHNKVTAPVMWPLRNLWQNVGGCNFQNKGNLKELRREKIFGIKWPPLKVCQICPVYPVTLLWYTWYDWDVKWTWRLSDFATSKTSTKCSMTSRNAVIAYFLLLCITKAGQYWQIDGNINHHSVFDANENCQARHGAHSTEKRYLASVDSIEQLNSLNNWDREQVCCL